MIKDTDSLENGLTTELAEKYLELHRSEQSISALKLMNAAEIKREL